MIVILIVKMCLLSLRRQRVPRSEHVLPPLKDLDLPQPEDRRRACRGLPRCGGGGRGGGEHPEEALSPSRPQVLETPESLSDSLYDSLSSCGSQG